tara:strand:- start:461 stop:1570 length:1110 start_codon:yes stop_codon:yes gene_type:complete
VNYQKKLYGEEPSWDHFEGTEDELQGQVIRAVNWYRNTGSSKSYKKWTVEWMKSSDSHWTKDDVDLVRSSDKKNFNRIGHYCRLMSRGCPPENNMLKTIKNEIESIMSSVKRKQVNANSAPRVSPMVRLKESVDKLACDMNVTIDSLHYSVMNGEKKFDPKLTGWLYDNKVTAKQAEMLYQMYTPVFDEVTIALSGEDEQLTEAYEYLGKRQLRKLQKGLDDILTVVKDHYLKNQKPRKTRTAKFDPAKAIKKINYMKSCDELGVKSIDPVKIIGAKKLVVFNTKYRYLQVFESSSHDGLMVKGSTIHNFDKDLSLMKTLRQPKDVLPKIKGIRSFNNNWSNIKTKERKVSSGRIGQHTILVQAYHDSN